MVLAGLGEAHHRVAEYMFAKRLLEHLVEPAGKRTFLEFGRWKCGYENRWPGPSPRAEAREHLKAIEIVHAVVGDEAARAVRERVREKRSARRIGADVKAPRAKQQLQ